MSYQSFNDLFKSEHPEDRMSHEFFIFLLDKLFGKHVDIRINAETESQQNHEIIKKQWKQIREYYGVPDSVKYTQKCVRQTIIQIVNRLNQKYGFIKPLKLEQKRHDYYSKEYKKNITDYWMEFNLN